MGILLGKFPAQVGDSVVRDGAQDQRRQNKPIKKQENKNIYSTYKNDPKKYLWIS